MANILSIGQSALNAANVAIATTGHNIANATTPGYSRQIVLQSAVAGQNMGVGYIGKGTEIAAIRRVYSDFLGTQILSTQTSKSQLDTYYAQIKQIDNMMADSSSGLSPALQDFFKGVQDLSAAAGSSASRQSLLSSAETLVARFQSMDSQLSEIRQGVNEQIAASVTAINVYSQQIAQLNDAIEKAQGIADGNMPNDLLDQRDFAIAELSKEVKVSVVKQGNSYDIYIGNGQPLVVGASTFNLKTVPAPTDPSRMEVAYENNGKTTIFAENGLTGGTLSGLFEFRSKTLDVAQNALGRVAIALASDFNAQHKLGMDLNGVMGKEFFNIQDPVITASSKNQGSLTVNDTRFVDASKLTTSDYQLKYDGANYHLTRLSDNVELASGTLAQVQDGAMADGFTFDITVTGAQAGDNFLIRPTVNGASGIGVAIADIAKIAAAGTITPISTEAASANTGTGAISAGTVDSTYVEPSSITTVTLVYNTDTATGKIDTSPTGAITGFPQTYVDGATISFGGRNFKISGTPNDGDEFTITDNKSGAGDNRNMLLLGALQSANTVAGKTTYQGAYSQLVNLIGNKTAELEATSTAAGKLLAQVVQTQQAESGVNLDEEAANLMRYQQAYQAAAKVMKTASDLFDVLLSLGN